MFFLNDDEYYLLASLLTSYVDQFGAISSLVTLPSARLKYTSKLDLLLPYISSGVRVSGSLESCLILVLSLRKTK